MLGRKKLAMLVAEFLGTGILTLAVLSVQRSQLGLAYFVAIAAGLTVVALTYAFSGCERCSAVDIMRAWKCFGHLRLVPIFKRNWFTITL